MTGRPTVALVTDLRDVDGMPYHVLGDKYAAAIHAFADCLPVGLVPSLDGDDVRQISRMFDGFVFTGSVSNIAPLRYGATTGSPLFDHVRDDFALPLIHEVLARGTPALFICRGFQELNVALGGSLNADLAGSARFDGHHPAADLPYDARYAPLHEVVLDPHSSLDDVFGAQRFAVNSLHYQGLDRIGAGLTVHGRSPDGLPEIIAVDGHPFAIGVQWHPEYRPDLHPANANLLRSFGEAARVAQSRGASAMEKR